MNPVFPSRILLLLNWIVVFDPPTVAPPEPADMTEVAIPVIGVATSPVPTAAIVRDTSVYSATLPEVA